MSHEKPPEIKNDAIKAAEGDKEARKRQQARGRKGGRVAAQKRKEQIHIDEAELSEREEQQVKHEIARLKESFPEGIGPEGEELSEEWYEEEAIATVRAIELMKQRQKEMLSKREK